jgi:hypothetical protein
VASTQVIACFVKAVHLEMLCRPVAVGVGRSEIAEVAAFVQRSFASCNPDNHALRKREDTLKLKLVLRGAEFRGDGSLAGRT